jgi:hypothetical protein
MTHRGAPGSGTGVRARRIVIADPEASTPVYPWGGAPEHLATRAQLAQRGLRPGRQGVQALVLWRSRRGGRPRVDGYRYAALYDIGRARPRIAMSERRAVSLAAALAARRRCPNCHIDRGYVPSVRLGVCNVCADELDLAA